MVKQRFLIEFNRCPKVGRETLIAMLMCRGLEGIEVKEQFFYDLDTKVSASYDITKKEYQNLSEYGLVNKAINIYNEIRRDLIISAIEEVLPGIFNKEKYEQNRTEYARELALELKDEDISIKHFKTDGGELPLDICCVYHNETPIHFFNYL